jgi:hypothetical protein
MTFWASTTTLGSGTNFPDIWINGHGAIVHATLPATASAPACSVYFRHRGLPNREMRLRVERLRVRGEKEDYIKAEMWKTHVGRWMYMEWNGLRLQLYGNAEYGG